MRLNMFFKNLWNKFKNIFKPEAVIFPGFETTTVIITCRMTLPELLVYKNANFTGELSYDNNINIHYKNGIVHRDDGPAIYFHNKEYYVLNGKRINCSSDEDFKKLIKLKAFW